MNYYLKIFRYNSTTYDYDIRTVQAEDTYISKEGIKIITDEVDDCIEASFYCRNDKLQLLPLDIVQIFLDDTALFLGEVRQGGNVKDTTLQKTVIRGLSERLKETILPQFSTPRLLISDFFEVLMGQLVNSLPFLKVFRVTGYYLTSRRIEAIEATNYQDVYSLLKKITQDNPDIKFGIDAEFTLFMHEYSNTGAGLKIASNYYKKRYMQLIRLDYKAIDAEDVTTALIIHLNDDVIFYKNDEFVKLYGYRFKKLALNLNIADLYEVVNIPYRVEDGAYKIEATKGDNITVYTKINQARKKPEVTTNLSNWQLVYNIKEGTTTLQKFIVSVLETGTVSAAFNYEIEEIEFKKLEPKENSEAFNNKLNQFLKVPNMEVMTAEYELFPVRGNVYYVRNDRYRVNTKEFLISGTRSYTRINIGQEVSEERIKAELLKTFVENRAIEIKRG